MKPHPSQPSLPLPPTEPKTYTVTSEDKVMLAWVIGRQLFKYVRPYSPRGHYRSPVKCGREEFASHKQAVLAADRWVGGRRVH